MEDSKKEIINGIRSTFQLPWVKALVAFMIFLAIFCAGAKFGSQYGMNNSRFQFQRNNRCMNQELGQNNQTQNSPMQNSSTMGGTNKPSVNSGTDTSAAPQTQNGVSQQGQQTQQPTIPASNSVQ